MVDDSIYEGDNLQILAHIDEMNKLGQPVLLSQLDDLFGEKHTIAQEKQVAEENVYEQYEMTNDCTKNISNPGVNKRKHHLLKNGVPIGILFIIILIACITVVAKYRQNTDESSTDDSSTDERNTDERNAQWAVTSKCYVLV